jgi:hypothetical protein
MSKKTETNRIIYKMKFIWFLCFLLNVSIAKKAKNTLLSYNNRVGEENVFQLDVHNIIIYCFLLKQTTRFYAFNKVESEVFDVDEF